MTSDQPGRRDADDSNRPPEPASPVSPLGSLPQLRNSKMRLFALLQAMELTPDHLDTQAQEVHERIVMPVYQVMRTEVEQACTSRWNMDGRRRLGERYEAAADNWPAYREALAELESARQARRSAVPALRELKTPRREYISALRGFYDEFSETLDFLFPC